MDSITHIVIGAAQGELLAGKKLGKKAMLWGAIANSLPDIDVLAAPFQRIEDSLLCHRGITHSILFAVIMSPLLGYVFYRWYKTKGVSFSRWLCLFALGMFTHIFIDAFTTYGTGWFEPFSHYRVSFNTIFVVDPFYTLPLIIAAIALVILKTDSAKRVAWARAGLVISSVYFLFTLYNKWQVDKVIDENIMQQHLPAMDYFSTPTPFNNFLWYAVIKEDKQYQLGYYSIFDKQKNISFYRVPENDNLLSKYKDNNAVPKLIRFSQNYYCITQSDTAGDELHDLRFGQIGGWMNPAAPFVFSYSLKPGATNKIVMQSGRLKAAGKDAMAGLIKRIKGN